MNLTNCYFNEHGVEVTYDNPTIPCFYHVIGSHTNYYVLYQNGALYDKMIKYREPSHKSYHLVDKSVHDVFLNYLKSNDYSFYTTAKKEIAAKGFQ